MKIDQGQKMFAGSVASALVRAWTERLGLRVVVDPRGGTSSAELTDDTGRVVWSQKAEGIQLELPLAPAAPRPRIADLRVPDPPGGEAPAPGACRECGGAGAHKMNCSRRGLPDGAPFVGDRITLEGDAVEVLGVDHEGFIWRTVDGERDEGDVAWVDVRLVSPGVWSTVALPPDGGTMLVSIITGERGRQSADGWADDHGLRWTPVGLLFWHNEGTGEFSCAVTSLPAEHVEDFVQHCRRCGFNPVVKPVEISPAWLGHGREFVDQGDTFRVEVVDSATRRVGLWCESADPQAMTLGEEAFGMDYGPNGPVVVLWPHDRETLTPAAERKKAKRERSSPKASAPKKAASKGKRKRP